MLRIKPTINSARAKAMQSVRDQAKQQGQEWIDTLQKQGEMAITGQLEAQDQAKQKQIEKKPETFSLFPDLTEVSPEEQKQLEDQSRVRLQRLEEELKQLRMQRTQEMQQWVKGQTQIMHPEEAQNAQGVPPKREIIMPTSKPKGPGAQGAVKAKQGSKEMGRQKST